MLSMMDRLWRPDLTEADALDLMHRGIEEVRTGHAGPCECAVALHACWRRPGLAPALVNVLHGWRQPCACTAGKLHLVLLLFAQSVV